MLDLRRRGGPGARLPHAGRGQQVPRGGPVPAPERAGLRNLHPRLVRPASRRVVPHRRRGVGGQPAEAGRHAGRQREPALLAQAARDDGCDAQIGVQLHRDLWARPPVPRPRLRARALAPQLPDALDHDALRPRGRQGGAPPAPARDEPLDGHGHHPLLDTVHQGHRVGAPVRPARREHLHGLPARAGLWRRRVLRLRLAREQHDARRVLPAAARVAPAARLRGRPRDGARRLLRHLPHRARLRARRTSNPREAAGARPGPHARPASHRHPEPARRWAGTS